jgi:hypothetical protein
MEIMKIKELLFHQAHASRNIAGLIVMRYLTQAILPYFGCRCIGKHNMRVLNIDVIFICTNGQRFAIQIGSMFGVQFTRQPRIHRDTSSSNVAHLTQVDHIAFLKSKSVFPANN